MEKQNTVDFISTLDTMLSSTRSLNQQTIEMLLEGIARKKVCSIHLHFKVIKKNGKYDTPAATCNVFQSSSLRCKFQGKLPTGNIFLFNLSRNIVAL